MSVVGLGIFFMEHKDITFYLFVYPIPFTFHYHTLTLIASMNER